jgi:hypothetical protein
MRSLRARRYNLFSQIDRLLIPDPPRCHRRPGSRPSRERTRTHTPVPKLRHRSAEVSVSDGVNVSGGIVGETAILVSLCENSERLFGAGTGGGVELAHAAFEGKRRFEVAVRIDPLGPAVPERPGLLRSEAVGADNLFVRTRK